MMSETEYGLAKKLIQINSTETACQNASFIVKTHFNKKSDMGMLRLQQHELFTSELKDLEFGKILTELFEPVPAEEKN